MAKGIFSFGKKKPKVDPPSPETPAPPPAEPPTPAPPPIVKRALTIPSEELFKILGSDLTPWMNTDKGYAGLPYRLIVAYGKKHRGVYDHEVIYGPDGARCAVCKFHALY